MLLEYKKLMASFHF